MARITCRRETGLVEEHHCGPLLVSPTIILLTLKQQQEQENRDVKVPVKGNSLQQEKVFCLRERENFNKMSISWLNYVSCLICSKNFFRQYTKKISELFFFF